MQPKVFGKTDVGKKRKNNEDAFLIDEELGLYAVADGMGGHAAGEVASNMALDITKKELNNWSGVLNEYKPDSSAEVRDVILNLIEETLQRACQAVYKESVDNPDRQGMGTTVSMVLIKNDSAFLGHVGDSRIYLVRQGAVHQLSEDHSLVNEMYKQGRIGTSEAEQASYRNVITRAVGHTERVRVDTLQMDLLPGDRLLLCSDGLSDYLRPGDIEKILKAGPVEESPDRFVARGKRQRHRRAGRDPRRRRHFGRCVAPPHESDVRRPVVLTAGIPRTGRTDERFVHPQGVRGGIHHPERRNH
jgi:serine/threonine protein phosphatase PrpC